LSHSTALTWSAAEPSHGSVTGFFSPIWHFPQRPSASGTRICPIATIG
jgi:hypothetical protein